ncbi:MAG: hypothetical protein HY788_08190 [Deltaproteobacteria bacterium]|nr:hypothetical protein [Deltaproteobacteria bacterium]
MSFRSNVRLCLFLGAWVIVCFTGCSTVEKAKDWVSDPESIYLKKIAVESVANRTYFRSDGMDLYVGSLGAKMTEIIQKDPWLKVMDPDSLAVLSAGENVSESIESIMAFGRKWGVSAFLKSSISELTYNLEKFGVYGFRDEIPTIRLLLQIQLIDTETGTVLFQGKGASTVKIDPRFQNLGDYLKENLTPPPGLLDDTLEDLAEEVLDALEDQHWRAFVVRVQDGAIEISSGKDVGLAGGAVLDVLRAGAPLTNYLGQTFLMPGKPVGKVRLTACDEHFCQAEALDQVEVQPGDSVGLPE